MEDMPQSKKRKPETKQQPEPETTEYLVERIKQLQTTVEKLKAELQTAKKIPSGKIGILFAVPGVLSLVYAVLQNSQVLAFIGLGLTFWAALFFFVRPVRYVKSSLLDSTVRTAYTTLDRIITDLNYHGKSYYIPPYPADVYLPEHLKGLKQMIVFISANRGAQMPTVQEIAESKFLLKNPEGICVAPPGLGLLTQFEKTLRTDLTKLTLTELCETLPPLILENFQLATHIEMTPTKKQVHIQITDSTYKTLYHPQEHLHSLHALGDPLTSALTCAIAKTTGKTVTLHRHKVSPNLHTIQFWCRFPGD